MLAATDMQTPARFLENVAKWRMISRPDDQNRYIEASALSKEETVFN